MVDEANAGVTCSVCYDEFPAWKHTHVGCGHNFCATCWSGYLGNAVSGGPSVLDLRCPQEVQAAGARADGQRYLRRRRRKVGRVQVEVVGRR